MGRMRLKGQMKGGIYRVGKVEDTTFSVLQTGAHSVVQGQTFNVLLLFNSFRVAGRTFGGPLSNIRYTITQQF